MEPLAVDVREAARLTSLSVHTIRAYCGKKRRIRAVRVGRRVLIPIAELERLVREGVPASQARKTGDD